jgi:hypothetical protein
VGQAPAYGKVDASEMRESGQCRSTFHTSFIEYFGRCEDGSTVRLLMSHTKEAGQTGARGHAELTTE